MAVVKEVGIGFSTVIAAGTAIHRYTLGSRLFRSARIPAGRRCAFARPSSLWRYEPM